MAGFSRETCCHDCYLRLLEDMCKQADADLFERINAQLIMKVVACGQDNMLTGESRMHECGVHDELPRLIRIKPSPAKSRWDIPNPLETS